MLAMLVGQLAARSFNLALGRTTPSYATPSYAKLRKSRSGQEQVGGSLSEHVAPGAGIFAVAS